MTDGFERLGINFSILERVMKMYYNRGLEEYEIGWGQQFYLEYIAQHPGVTPQELTDYVHVDRGTVTKVIKKLSEMGYISVAGDGDDRRVRHIYLKKDAEDVLFRIKELHKEFYSDLTAGFSDSEKETLKKQTDQMIWNLTQKVRYKMEEPYWRTKKKEGQDDTDISSRG